MPSCTITPRPIYIEDLAKTTTRGATEEVEVLGVGTVTLRKCDLLSLSDIAAAASDATAALAGVPVGGLYYSTTTGHVHARLS
jgi:hypothetical protein